MGEAEANQMIPHSVGSIRFQYLGSHPQANYIGDSPFASAEITINDRKPDGLWERRILGWSKFVIKTISEIDTVTVHDGKLVLISSIPISDVKAWNVYCVFMTALHRKIVDTDAHLDHQQPNEVKQISGSAAASGRRLRYANNPRGHQPEMHVSTPLNRAQHMHPSGRRQ